MISKESIIVVSILLMVGYSLSLNSVPLDQTINKNELNTISQYNTTTFPTSTITPSTENIIGQNIDTETTSRLLDIRHLI